MQQLQDELSEYQKFRKKYFTKFSGMALFEKNHVPIRKIYQALGFCEIAVDYDYLSKNVKSEFKRIQLSLLNLLIALPCGNELFITVITRQISEEILRVIYMNAVNDIDEHTHLSFNKIWAKGLKKSSYYKKLSNDVKKNLDSIANYFSQDSIKLHNVTSGNPTKLSGYLQNLVEDCQIASIKLLSTELNTLCNSVLLLKDVYDINYNKMTMPQKKIYTYITYKTSDRKKAPTHYR